MSDATDNPYAAPPSSHIEPEPDRVTADHPWLIQRRGIVCGDELHLPPVCLATGRIEDLVRRERVLARLRPVYTTAGALVVLLLTLMESVFVPSQFEGSFMGLLFVYFVAVVVIQHWSAALARTRLGPLFQQINTSWYVSRRHVKWSRVSTILARAVVVVVGGVFSYLLAENLDGGWRFAATLGVVVLCLVLAACLVIERRLTITGTLLIGKNRGRFLLTGHSRAFTKAVRQRVWEQPFG